MLPVREGTSLGQSDIHSVTERLESKRLFVEQAPRGYVPIAKFLV